MRKVSYVMMTNEEYDAIEIRIKALEYEVDQLDCLFGIERERSALLWDALNRPAIEESARKHEEEFLDWCDEMAEKYEKLDEEEWLTDRAKFYNNGLINIANLHQIPNDCEFAREILKYKDMWWVPVATWRDFWYKPGETEGWSDVPHFAGSRLYNPDVDSWIMMNAQNDVYGRYNRASGSEKEKLWKLWISFQDQKRESECLGNSYNEFYR